MQLTPSLSLFATPTTHPPVLGAVSSLCRKYVPEYEKAATALKGLLTVAAINGKTISDKMREQYDVQVGRSVGGII